MLRPNGRLVIIDLAPHSLEYLREEHAHVRLGFSHQTMEEWLKKTGLKPETAVDLHSGNASAQSLDVTIWVARDPRLLMAGEETMDAPLLSAGRA